MDGTCVGRKDRKDRKIIALAVDDPRFHQPRDRVCIDMLQLLLLAVSGWAVC